MATLNEWLDKIKVTNADTLYETPNEEVFISEHPGIVKRGTVYECYVCDVHIGDFELLDDAKRMKKRFKYINRDSIGRSTKFVVNPKGNYRLNITNIDRLLKGVRNAN